MSKMLAVIPEQSLSPADFARFARIFGRPEPHILSHLRLPDFPEILPLSNVFEKGEPIGVYDGAAYWHTDMSYRAEPPSTSLLFALEVPEEGGDTGFANMYLACEELPAALRDLERTAPGSTRPA